MTENRCIEVLKKMKHMFTETCAKIDENTALDMTIKALEEIQAYRAIGTVEECHVAVERMKPKKAIEIVGYGMECPHCGLRYLNGKPRHCERCDGTIDWSN